MCLILRLDESSLQALEYEGDAGGYPMERERRSNDNSRSSIGSSSSSVPRREAAQPERGTARPPARESREREEGKARDTAAASPVSRGQYRSPALRRRAEAKP